MHRLMFDNFVFSTQLFIIQNIFTNELHQYKNECYFINIIRKLNIIYLKHNALKKFI